ncbi:MAG: DNA polymerase III subunit alpha [Fimbriimonadales bacterium]
MSKPFVHIHNHTEYSLLDGAQRIPQMVARAKELGMPALAITDHGAMFGAMEFYLECKKQGVKPIIGMEAYVAPEGLHKRSAREENSTYHLLLLAKNKVGYQNLCKLATISSLEGFYYKPRIDHEALKEHAEGLISTTTCLGSEINQYLLQGDYDKAQRTAGLYKEILGDGNYFVELQDHGLKEQAQIKDDLLRISRELDLPLVCTNDSHYLCEGDYQAHDVLLCIQTNAKVADNKRMRFETNEFYLKSPEQMEKTFADTPEAYENTSAIADMCSLELGSDRVELPDPEIPEGLSSQEYLSSLALAGLRERFANVTEKHEERLRYELGVIDTTGFQKYLLLVREFAKFTREQGIYFGVRGSAAGSLVSYCLGITDIDPVEHDLMFERFLNPERIEMPDIDMDFEDARRDEVISYVRDRFGEDRVAQIITFGTLGAKAAMRDAGRALAISPIDVDRLCKLVPSIPGTTIERTLHDIPEFKRAYAEDATAKQLIDTAKSIEGVSRHYGVHAAGVVISKEPLRNTVPLAKGSDDQIITQFPMDMLEKAGLLKMDFLGLSNLTVLSRAVQNVEAAGKGKIDILNIPTDDAKSYEVIGRGETVGIFQLEGGGMTRYVQELKPQNIGELAAMVALYRPGPMEHIPRYIRGKFGLEKLAYIDPRMEETLAETYGVIVYQDQVIHLVRALAGFSLGEADILRKAMGKKDKKAMASAQTSFISRAVELGMAEADANEVFDLLLPFAGYAFNKAHAVCYGTIAYQTAYMKANYPVEYMAALLGVYQGKEDRVVGCIEECRRMGIRVLAPDVNRSSEDFTVEAMEDGTQSAVRFGLAAIKGIGSAAVQGILRAREEGPFKHLFELAETCRLQGGFNKLALEALIKAGALESLDPNRAKLLVMLDTALAFAERSARDKLSGQDSLFGGNGEEPGSTPYPILPDVPMQHRRENLAMEKEVMGLYLSDHPLRGYERTLASAATHSAAAIAELEDSTQVTIAGVVTSFKQIRTKSKNELMATLTLEDFSGQATVTVFPSSYAATQHLLAKDRIIAVQGHIQHRERRGDAGTLKMVEVIARGVSAIAEPGAEGEDEDHPSKVPGTLGTLLVQVLRASLPQLRRARELFERNPGEFSVMLEIGSNGTTKVIPTKHLVSDGPWIVELRRTFEHGFVKIGRN